MSAAAAIVPPGVPLDVSRARPRAFAEWRALRRWGKLPPWERQIVGYLLRDARLGAGLTQRELGARLGVTQQAVAQAERWSANPTVAFIASWARRMDARYDASTRRRWRSFSSIFARFAMLPHPAGTARAQLGGVRRRATTISSTPFLNVCLRVSGSTSANTGVRPW